MIDIRCTFCYFCLENSFLNARRMLATAANTVWQFTTCQMTEIEAHNLATCYVSLSVSERDESLRGMRRMEDLLPSMLKFPWYEKRRRVRLTMIWQSECPENCKDPRCT